LNFHNSRDHSEETIAVDLNLSNPGLEKAEFNLGAGIFNYIDNKGELKYRLISLQYPYCVQTTSKDINELGRI
jgi:hypothetical protein